MLLYRQCAETLQRKPKLKIPKNSYVKFVRLRDIQNNNFVEAKQSYCRENISV